MSIEANVDRRLSRRREAVSRARRKRILTRLGVAGGLVLLVYLAFYSPLLSIREVRIQGAKHTGDAAIAEALGAEGENLLRISTARLEERAEALPWVAEATIDRMLPGALRVRIEERRPALLVTSGTDRWVVDLKGNVLGEATGEGLPALAGIQVGELTPGDRISDPALVGALDAYRRLSRPLKAKVEALIAPTPERITLALKGGTQVRYGAAERMEAKNKVLRVVLARLAQEGSVASYIDVRVPTSPAVVRGVAGTSATPAPTPSVP